MNNRTYVSIDLKSFYASVECMERGLDPLATNLVVADSSRTEKTICLAVSPSLKAYGIPGRPRLFEVTEAVRRINARRLQSCIAGEFSGKSYNAIALKKDESLELDFITAVPRMSYYMEYSGKIYDIYLKYVAAEDIHVYSIDEVFMDVTDYLGASGLNAKDFTMRMIMDILKTTGITATAGIGTNLYLCKIAMDILAKHVEPDKNGVRIAYLDEMSYRRELWEHRPITDFWRVGRGYAKKLEVNGMHTMGDVARCSIGAEHDFHNEDLLYKLFGVNAQLLIDHAWGWENCTIADIKSYRPENNSLCSGQVLHEPYEFDKARLVVSEMADMLALDLLDKRLVTDQLLLLLNYDTENINDEKRRKEYNGKVTRDYYGRRVPEKGSGSINLKRPTSSSRLIMDAAAELMDSIADRRLLIRKLTITANHVLPEGEARVSETKQLDMFTDYQAEEEEENREIEELEREKRRQKVVLSIKKRYGKNAILRGMNLQEGATSVDRNNQIGGHKA